jgi:hypothetical protein
VGQEISKVAKMKKGELKSTQWGIWGGLNIFIKSTPNQKKSN